MSQQHRNGQQVRRVRSRAGELRYKLPRNAIIGSAPTPDGERPSGTRGAGAPDYHGDPSELSNLFAERRKAISERRADDVERIEAEIKSQPWPERDRAERVSQIELALNKLYKGDEEKIEAAIEESREGLTEFLRDKDVAYNVDPHILDKILDSGRILSQRDEGAEDTGGGTWNPDYRAKVENAWFGEHEAAPVYGYMRDRRGGPSGADDYGSVAIVFNDDVRNGRSTVAVGDSLNDEQRVFPGPIDNPGRYTAQPTLVEFAQYQGYGRFADYLNDGAAPESNEYGFYREHYVEAQIHGGVTVDDIAHVVFSLDPPAGTRRALEDRGIRWSVRDDDFDNELAGYEDD